MSSEQNEAIVRTLFDAWNTRQFGRALDIADQDVESVIVPLGRMLYGHPGLQQFMESWATAFPDGQAEIRNMISGENGAVAEFIGIGTHTGTLWWPTGEILPTGRTIEMPFCQVYQIREGKLTSQRLYFDDRTLMRQLALTPERVVT